MTIDNIKRLELEKRFFMEVYQAWWKIRIFYIKIHIRIYYYGDCPVENLNLYAVKDEGSGTSFSGTRSGTVYTLEFAVISTHAETILRKK